MVATTNGFQDFLKTEIKKRQLTPRQFAFFVGVDPSTMTRALDEKKPPAPTVEFVVKVARATHTNAMTLMAMAYPEIAEETNINPSWLLLAQQFEQLPEDFRNVIMAIIRTASTN